MDRSQQITTDIIRLYREHLNALGKKSKDSDSRRCDRRRERIAELRKELEMQGWRRSAAA
jgi:cation transport regulator ChaB